MSEKKREYTEKQRQQNREWRERNVDKIKGYRRKYKESGKVKDAQYRCRYGITSQEVALRKETQNFTCPACGSPFGTAVTAVDHCHVTGKVRGIIHRQCNLMIGLAKENPLILKKAAEYLLSQT